MLKNLEALNSLTIGMDAPIGRIIEKFVKMALSALFTIYLNKQAKMKMPAALIIVEDLETIRKNLRESIFTLIDYNQYSLLDDQTRKIIKDRLATALYQSFTQESVFNEFKDTNKEKDFSIVFPLAFFETQHLKRILQSECDNINKTHLAKPIVTTESTSSFIKNSLKSWFKINNSPQAVRVASEGEALTLVATETTLLFNYYDQLASAYQTLNHLNKQEIKDKLVLFNDEVNRLDALYSPPFPQPLLASAARFLTQDSDSTQKMDYMSRYLFSLSDKQNDRLPLDVCFGRLGETITEFKRDPTLKQLRVVRKAADEFKIAFTSYEELPQLIESIKKDSQLTPPGERPHA